jgi:hypothetical protein
MEVSGSKSSLKLPRSQVPGAAPTDAANWTAKDAQQRKLHHVTQFTGPHCRLQCRKLTDHFQNSADLPPTTTIAINRREQRRKKQARWQAQQPTITICIVMEGRFSALGRSASLRAPWKEGAWLTLSA